MLKLFTLPSKENMSLELFSTAVAADLKAVLDSLNADPAVASILVLICDGKICAC